jgi:hypothetical protein
MADASSILIDSVFMAKLLASELYGQPKEGLADRLKERAPRGLTEEGLQAAAEDIIRHRGAGSFPAFPDCMAAIERNATRIIAKPLSGMDDVTKDNYAERASAFCRRAGLANGAFPTVRRADDSRRWETWQAYFSAIGMHAMAQHMNGGQVMTVPAEWPWHFDPASPVTRAIEPEPEAPRRFAPEARFAA